MGTKIFPLQEEHHQTLDLIHSVLRYGGKEFAEAMQAAERVRGRVSQVYVNDLEKLLKRAYPDKEIPAGSALESTPGKYAITVKTVETDDEPNDEAPAEQVPVKAA